MSPRQEVDALSLVGGERDRYRPLDDPVRGGEVERVRINLSRLALVSSFRLNEGRAAGRLYAARAWRICHLGDASRCMWVVM